MDDDTVAFLESGCALIVGAVGGANEPVATRGWGADVIDDATRLRVILDADDTSALDALTAGAPLAVTGADVVTLRSLQAKGRVVEVGEAGRDDDATTVRAARYCEEFFADITATDGTPREVLEQIVPSRFVAVVMTAEEWFDQTPGPGAGAAREARA